MKLVGKFPHAKLVAVGSEPPALLLSDTETVPGSDTDSILLLVVVEKVEMVDEGRGVCDEDSI